MQPTQQTCLNCGAGFFGNYCNQCGEKVYSQHDKKLSHFFEEGLHFITHFDTKFLKTLWTIFSKPGFYSKEYCEGKRKKYFKPVSLFLISIVIYLLFPLLQGMNISLGNHINNNKAMHIGYSLSWAKHKMEKQHISEGELSAKFNHISPKFAKILLLLLLPLSAFSLSLLFRNRKRYFFDHFILATEFNTFSLLAFFLIIPAIFILTNTLTHLKIDYGDVPLFWIFQILIILTVLTASFRTFYGVKFFEALLKSILFMISFLVILFIYRQITFIAVMLFI